MPWIRKSDHERFFANLETSPVEWRGKGWFEKGSDKKLLVAAFGRSIWERPFMGGSGEVRKVEHLYIEGEPDPAKNMVYGASIYEDELMQVSHEHE